MYVLFLEDVEFPKATMKRGQIEKVIIKGHYGGYCLFIYKRGEVIAALNEHEALINNPKYLICSNKGLLAKLGATGVEQGLSAPRDCGDVEAVSLVQPLSHQRDNTSETDCIYYPYWL